MTKWLSRLEEIKKNKNALPPLMSPLSVMSVPSEEEKLLKNININKKKDLYILTDKTDKTDIGRNPQSHQIVPLTSTSHVSTLTSDEITCHREMLETSYRNPHNDHLHGSDLPQKFRAGEHTFDEMAEALESFIQLSPAEQARFRMSSDEATHQEAELSRKVDSAIDALIDASEALPEYRLQRCRGHTFHGQDQKAYDETSIAYQKALVALIEASGA